MSGSFYVDGLLYQGGFKEPRKIPTKRESVRSLLEKEDVEMAVEQYDLVEFSSFSLAQENLRDVLRKMWMCSKDMGSCTV